MQDAALMRVMNGARQLRDQFRRTANGNRLARGNRIQLAAFHELHAKKASAVAFPDFVDRYDAWMVEAGGSFRFKTETLDMRFRGPIAESDNFERYNPIQT